jgi:hypothetical protein
LDFNEQNAFLALSARFSLAYFNKPVFLNTIPRYLYLSVISIILWL